MAHGIRLLSCLQSSRCNIAVVLLHANFTDAEFLLLVPKLEILRKNCSFLCAADSGANFLYDRMRKGNHSEPATHKDLHWIPDLIAGDFDSIRPEVLEHFRQNFRTTEIVHTPDQDETDFTKALQLTIKALDNKNINVDFIVALCSGNGRLDHVMANINTLFRAHTFTQIPVIMLSGNELQYALDKAGDYEFKLDVGLEGPFCGLIPVHGPCHVITSGLKWDLSNERLEFGGLVSTSNELLTSVVRIWTDEPLLFTMSVKDITVHGANANVDCHYTEADR